VSGAKPISYTALRTQLGEALKPIRLALHGTKTGEHEPVDFMGYRFTGARAYKAPGQTGYVWNAYYRGEPISEENRERWATSGNIGGGIEDCATQMFSRLRAMANATGNAS
jgi:hypothetical protein